jgi:hypothetical protein
MMYPEDMDQECIPLCDAMNSLPGIKTVSSCCGHGVKHFGIFFTISGDANAVLPPLLYWFDDCHLPKRDWRISVFTDCSADGATFFLESPCVGKEAYQEAALIAEKLLMEKKEACNA